MPAVLINPSRVSLTRNIPTRFAYQQLIGWISVRVDTFEILELPNWSLRLIKVPNIFISVRYPGPKQKQSHGWFNHLKRLAGHRNVDARNVHPPCYSPLRGIVYRATLIETDSNWVSPYFRHNARCWWRYLQRQWQKSFVIKAFSIVDGLITSKLRL